MQNIILHTRFKIIILFFLALFMNIAGQAQPDVSYQPVIGPSEGLSNPIELVTAPGDASGRLFIVEKAGRVKIWNGNNLLPTPFIDISDRVLNSGERGLLSMAFHPQYQSNGFFFLYYYGNDNKITLGRYKVSSDPNIAESEADPGTPLFSVTNNAGLHNGGHLQFRTESGTPYLYFATGDGGSGNDPDNNSQNPDSYLGKMIRINVNAASPVAEKWAWGLRNPFRWSFDRSTGDIWIGDVGESLKEEINYRPLGVWGANYGWVCKEGTDVNSSGPGFADCDTVKDVAVQPVFEYENPGEGKSVIGGYVYRGSEFPDLQGYYLATDFFSGNLWLIKKAGASWVISKKEGMPARISSISEAANGALYAVAYTSNTVFKIITPVVTPLHLINFSALAMAGFNEVKWVTAAEENMDKYIVEYSTDGINYVAAGELPSLNNNNRNVYSYRHININTTTIFYRLQMVELNGTYKYSPVIRVGADEKREIKVYPTSISNGLLNIVSGQPVDRVTVIGLNGVQLLSKEMNGTSGYFNLSLPSLQKGLYIVRISGKNFQHTEKIMIQ